MAGPSLLTLEDHPAPTLYNTSEPKTWDPGTPDIFDPYNIISTALLNQLASATSSNSSDLCHPFIRPGYVIHPEGGTAIPFSLGLLDTGAQGSNFVSRALYSKLPVSITQSAQPIDRVVRLGDARNLSIQLEVPLTLSILDSQKVNHQHRLWFSVLEVLSHDVIIGLVDLIGPYYDLFADSVTTSRQVAVESDLGSHLSVLTMEVQSITTVTPSAQLIQQAQSITEQHDAYCRRKQTICSSPCTQLHLMSLQDGSAADVLTHPRHGNVFADDRIEARYNLLTSLLASPMPGTIVQPWSKPIDALAPEETETPDPTSFPDDILVHLTTSTDEARTTYHKDLDTHISEAMLLSCPSIKNLLTSQLAYDVFVPRSWPGINMEPYHLELKPGLPDFLKARSRPIRDALYQDAKTEFNRMRTYFYEKSTSPIACPLVVAPKATAPFIRLCGDYRPINPYVHIPQEPIPHVQQSLAKAAGWNVFVDLDMTNSFHQIPIDLPSSNLLSVSTPWGLFRPKFLPEGVGPASGILQSIVRRVFLDFEDWIIVIFDNFLILASDFQDAYMKLEKVLIRCKDHGLILKMKKSFIGTTVVTFFGYEVKPGSWGLSQSRKDSINAMVFPQNQKQMQSFLGAANFFHHHIPNYSAWAASLYECTVTSFDWKSTNWPKDYRGLFELFKTAIQQSVTLNFPNYALPWVIRSDSSDHAVGAVLFQEFTDSSGLLTHQPIAFASQKYSGAAINWDVYKKEAYALYFAVVQFSYYLRGKEFLLETDHRNLVWLETSHVPIIVRWRVLLQSYCFTVRHIPGVNNKVADWLSRMYPIVPSVTSVTTLSPLLAQPSFTDMFNAVHGSRSLHHGARRTYLALCERYPGHGIPLRVIQDKVAECSICQKDRLPLITVPHIETVETLLHHKRTIGIDHVTITPHDEDGYIGLLLIVELDTKFPQAYPVRDYTAVTVATVLFKHFCTFGRFDAIFSDPGSAFTSTILDHLNRWLGISHCVSVIGRHESNGTEHVNALFMGHLRRLVHDERLTHRWASDTVLPLINHAMATMPNSELGGFSPSELKFGSKDSAHFLLPQNLSPGHQYSSLVRQLDENLASIRAITHDYQVNMRQNRQDNGPSTSSRNFYQAGDLVLWNPKEHPHSFRSSKLAPKLLGPYRVLSQNKNDVKCVHTTLHSHHTLHVSRITPYFGSLPSAENISLLDASEFVIDSISAHKGDWKRLSSLTFCVSWVGYDSNSDTWEPWRNLRDTRQLHDYLRAIGKSKLIPSTHR